MADPALHNDDIDSDTEELLQEKDNPFAAENHAKKGKYSRAKPFIKPALALGCLILLVLISFGIGVLLGWKLFQESGSSESKTPASRNDWGESISVDGRTVPIGKWMSDNIEPKNIKDNLK